MKQKKLEMFRIMKTLILKMVLIISEINVIIILEMMVINKIKYELQIIENTNKKMLYPLHITSYTKKIKKIKLMIM